MNHSPAPWTKIKAELSGWHVVDANGEQVALVEREADADFILGLVGCHCLQERSLERAPKPVLVSRYNVS